MDKLISFILIVLMSVITILMVAALFAYPLMYLWNWLMPEIFGLTTIGFWQAVGIMILSGFLFGSTNTNSKSNKDK